MILRANDSTAYYVRTYAPILYNRFKQRVKKEIILQGIGCELFFRWHTVTPSTDLLGIRQKSRPDYIKTLAEGLCILTDQDISREEESPGIWYAPIYMPFIDSTMRWLEPAQRRKAVIDEVLRDMRMDDPRTFGERMRDLRKEKLQG